MKPWMRTTVVISSWTLGLVGLSLGLVLALQPRESARKVTTKVRIHQPKDQVLLIASDLCPSLASEGWPWTGKTAKEINISMLEEKLKSHELVQDAEVFSTWDGTVYSVVKQKVAKARISNGLQSAYCDASGNLFPLSKHDKPRLPLVTGTYTRARRAEALRLLNRAAQHSSFRGGWYALDFKPETGFTAFPEWHPHRIVWGDASEFARKAHRAKALYAYALQNKTLDQLERLDVRFEDQVVFMLTSAPSQP
jgi:cell division protein FtsQ